MGSAKSRKRISAPVERGLGSGKGRGVSISDIGDSITLSQAL
jgi:hypothetical protein